MTPLLKKLQYKAPDILYVLNYPAAFEEELKGMQSETPVSTEWPHAGEVAFVLVFVQSQEEIESMLAKLLGRLKGDAVLWFAFPKKSSKKYTVEINRDRGWDSLIQASFVPVRAISIDADWTALRFRQVEYIKSMTRTFNLPKQL